jgi:PAS domain S-box-containing protein
MEVDTGHTADQIKRLQGCINDLISVLALPALWTGQESSHVVSTLLDVLVGMLRLDFAYARLSDTIEGAPIEMVRLAQRRNPDTQPQEVGRALQDWLTGEPPNVPFVAPNPIGEGNISIAPFRLGLQDETGLLLAASRRADFPTAMELMLLRVAANQAVIGLHEARLLSDQRRVADELERWVAKRTAQLTAVNEELEKEITERKRVEDELRRSEAYLAEGQRISHTGTWAWNVFSGELFWSLENFRIFGLDPESVKVSYPMVLQWIHPEDRFHVQQSFDEAAREKSDYELECRVVRPDGMIKHIHSLAHPVFNESGDLTEYVGTVMDITERKRAEEELRTAQGELARVTRVTAMGELAASIAHEVNQPLAAVVTNGNAGLRWLAAASPNLGEAREALGRIIRDGNRASDVIARIRALLKKTSIEKERLNMNEAIQDVIAIAQGEMRRNGVTLRTELSEDLPSVIGDRVQLQQVALNLIMNGIEAMSAVGDRPRELVVATQMDGADGLHVTVQDSGIGLEPQNPQRIFDAFYTTKREGMGMGLSISRSIIEAHNGRLWATSNDGPGATLHFTLPVVQI